MMILPRLNTQLDKILTTGPLIVKLPGFFANRRAIGGNDLIILQDRLPAQKLRLLSGGSVPFQPFANAHHPQGDSLGQDLRHFPHLDPEGKPAHFRQYILTQQTQQSTEGSNLRRTISGTYYDSPCIKCGETS